MQKIAFTLCSNNYLAQAKTLGDSLIAFNPDIRFVIGLVDKFHASVDYDSFKPFEILPYNRLPYPEFETMVSEYNIVEFNTAVKPFYIDHFFSTSPGCQVYYIDPDIQIFNSLSQFEKIFAGDVPDAGGRSFDFILTPHLVKLNVERSPFERQILNVGIYNLGFLGIRDSENGRSFVSWWMKRLTTDCRIDFAKGLFVDQIWVNYLPAFYDSVYTLRDPGYNMGYWNFTERTISKHSDKYFVNETNPLVFFHFSSFSPLIPDVLCKHLPYSFEKRPDLVELYETYSALLLKNDFGKLNSLERLLEFKKNHPYADKQVEGLTLIKERLKKYVKRIRKKN